MLKHGIYSDMEHGLSVRQARSLWKGVKDICKRGKYQCNLETQSCPVAQYLPF